MLHHFFSLSRRFKVVNKLSFIRNTPINVVYRRNLTETVYHFDFTCLVIVNSIIIATAYGRKLKKI